MSQDTPTIDYHAPDIAELAQQRGGVRNDPLNRPDTPRDQNITRAVAWQLIPACAVVPGLLWCVLIFGVHEGWYELATCFAVFVYTVTVVFGLIVCLNLRKLSRMETQKTKAQEELRIAKDVAEAANRFKSAFFANISHEIRTPLTAINGFAELMLNPERTVEQRQEDARIIHRNGEHLLTLINDILDISKIEAGKMSVESTLCCPAQVIGEVCSMLLHRADEKGLTLDINFEGPIPKTIRTDPTRLRQVMINLIANAIKFTKEGGVRVTVSIKPAIRAPSPVIQVSITDTGIGIPADRLASLFQPFVQGDASITRQYGGSGLGLAISQYFARALGGDISVLSEAGRGSTFTVTIGTGSLADVELHERPEEVMKALNKFNESRFRINGRVLIAEDGIDNQALIATRIREAGATVELAANGQIALEKAMAAVANGAPFDLILMDVQMPVMDGFAATLELRSRGYRGPIIALTANAGERDRTKCLNAGCNNFVTKPIKLEELFKAIGRYLRVARVAPKPALTPEAAAAAAASHAVLAQKFYQDLPGELAQMEQAIERQDRAQLKEVAKLLLGKSAAAGLRDLAPQAARLLMSAENEGAWENLKKAVTEFAKESQPKSSSQAA